jgi:hypothetical protein
MTTENTNTLVGLLTTEQKNSLVGHLFMPDCYFNPIQDLYDNWIISTQEIDECINPDFLWVQDLELITYEPKPRPIP